MCKTERIVNNCSHLAATGEEENNNEAEEEEKEEEEEVREEEEEENYHLTKIFPRNTGNGTNKVKIPKTINYLADPGKARGCITNTSMTE